MQRQGDGFVAGRWVKYEQYRYAMFIAVVAITDACVAFDDEPVVGKGAEIVETIEVGRYLRANASGQISIVGLENGPLRGTRNGVNDLQTESARGQLREFPVRLTTPTHRDGTGQASTTSWPVGDYVQARTAE
jgi:hypothetical protein